MRMPWQPNLIRCPLNRGNIRTSKDMPVLPLVSWSLFVPTNRDSRIELPFIEPLLRRRLSKLSRMALKVAYDCAHDLPSVSTIFASRHGEIHGSVAMLHDISNRNKMSPTTFSLSVHNAVLGLFSIARADRSPSSAISAGCDTFFAALQEAAVRFYRDMTKPILLIYADEILPDELAVFASSTDKGHAMALLFSQSDAAKHLFFQWGQPRGKRNIGDPAIAFANFLNSGGTQFNWNGPRHSWEMALQ